MNDRVRIHQFTCLSDNFGVLVHDPETGATASIDAPEAKAVEAALRETGWALTDILVTHHHHDHTGGIADLKAAHGATVTGPADEADKIKGLDKTVSDGEIFKFGSLDVHAISTPGHTLGQVSFWIPDAAVAFTGDTLFALGCGRVFEGTPAQMWASLDRLRKLPAETTIYCGHEYTLANAKFAVTVDPENAQLKDRLAEIERLRAANQPTLPTTMELELATNPFLRADATSVAAAVGMPGGDPADVFTEVRRRKDTF